MSHPDIKAYYPGAENFGVEGLQPGGDTLLHIDVYYYSPARQVFLKWSKGMEITGHGIGPIRRVVHNF